MTRRLVMIHGRAQQKKDSIALKAEWLDALREGLRRAGLALPIAETDIVFPYYGDTLDQLVQGLSPAQAAQVVMRGTATSAQEKAFAKAIIDEMIAKGLLTPAQLAEAGPLVVERGLLQWEWFQDVLELVDRHVPLASGASIALFTHDVYQYLHDDTVRGAIDDGIAPAIQPDTETVVVAHSLGTVIAYRLLRQMGERQRWKVPHFITLGSPLAVQAICDRLRREAPVRCPPCAGAWFNAFDKRDIVALYPLDSANFPLAPERPAIENHAAVDNDTENRHGIGGYLKDPVVARRIHDALVG